MNFQDWFTAKFKSKGYRTQKEIAHLLNVDESILSRWVNEEDTSPFPMDQADRVCEVLEFDENERIELFKWINELHKLQGRPHLKKVIEHKGLVIDLDTHEVMLQDERLNLSPTEFKLLSCLVKHKGRVLSREFLLKQGWGQKYTGPEHLRSYYLRSHYLYDLDLYIAYLRKKVEIYHPPKLVIQIKNEAGIGFRLW